MTKEGGKARLRGAGTIEIQKEGERGKRGSENVFRR